MKKPSSERVLGPLDVHSQEMPARLARRTAYIYDAAYCRQCPDLAQCALTVSGSIGQAVLLLPYILSYMCALVLCMVLSHSVSEPLFQEYLPHLSGSSPQQSIAASVEEGNQDGTFKISSQFAPILEWSPQCAV